jgi:hypothetical protein
MYEAYTVSYRCTSAASYIRQLAGAVLPDRTYGDENHVGGVPGFYCVAYPDRHGHAYAGSCHRGAVEFGWNWNVIFSPTLRTGRLGRVRTDTSSFAYSATLHTLGGGRYRLQVGNTSGIGSIDAFTWSPPSGLTITAVSSAKGATCAVAANGSITCRGKLHPPRCLCETNGGAVDVYFTASGLKPSEENGHPVYSFLGNGHIRITKMTPVPYLIPETQEELKGPKSSHGA